MKGTQRLIIIVGLIALAAGLYAQEWLNPPPKGKYNAENKILIVPEAERPLGFIIIGLWPHGNKYYFLPDITKISSAPAAQKREVEKQFYWLNFAFSHGEILKYIPKYTELFVALPDRSKVKESMGGEKEFFLGYLKTMCGFTDAEINKRVHFFMSDIQLEWPQDTCKVMGRMGRDEKNRALLAMSKGDRADYADTVENLVKDFPDQFSLKLMADEISGEGGDEDIAWTPDGQVAFFAGRHRVLQYIYKKTGTYPPDNVPITQEQIEEARQAFSKELFGMPVYFIPERALLDPSLGCSETFHFDMFATMLPNPGKGMPRVFIPTYRNMRYIIDSLTRQKLDKNMVRQAQSEYDLSADQFKALGYEVVRLPFNDHPVRNPVNIIKYHNNETGRYTVMISKYPNYLPEGNPDTAQAILQNALDRLAADTSLWQNSQTDGNYKTLQSTISNLWNTMGKVEAMPNTNTDSERKIFEKYGYGVVEVPVYAWGAGGLHCQLLY
jgi:hypothetical protein